MKFSTSAFIILASVAAAAPVNPGESALEDPTGIVTTPLSHVIDGVISALNGNFKFSGTVDDVKKVGQGAAGMWQGVQQQAQQAQQQVQGGQQGGQSAVGSAQPSGQQSGGILSGIANGISGLLGGGNKPADGQGGQASASTLPFIGGLFQGSGSNNNQGSGSLLGNLFQVGSSNKPGDAAATVKANGGASSTDLSVKVTGFPQELSEQNLRTTIGKLNLGLSEEQLKYTIQLIQTLVAAFFTGKQIPDVNTIKDVIPDKVPGNLNEQQADAINRAIYPTLNIVLRNPGTLNGMADTIKQVLTRGN